MAQGRCLCGTVQYEVGGPFNMMANCHCSMCRKHHGTAFATFVAAPLESFSWKSGEDNITEYASSEKGKRPFCNTCGSVTPTLSPEMQLAIVPAGNLEGDLGTKPQIHMFVGSKAPWYTITDDLPQYSEWPPEFAGQSFERPKPEYQAGTYGGSCLCGSIAFEIDGPPFRMQSCHCSRCRRARSSAHGTNLFVKKEQLRWTRGDALLTHFKVPDAHFHTVGFCRQCGGAMPVISEMRGIAIVPCGSLDADPGMRAFAHIFVNDKAPWFTITDTLLQFPGAPPPPAPPPSAT
jgi:hypothetical protein